MNVAFDGPDPGHRAPPAEYREPSSHTSDRVARRALSAFDGLFGIPTVF